MTENGENDVGGSEARQPVESGLGREGVGKTLSQFLPLIVSTGNVDTPAVSSRVQGVVDFNQSEPNAELVQAAGCPSHLRLDL